MSLDRDSVNALNPDLYTYDKNNMLARAGCVEMSDVARLGRPLFCSGPRQARLIDACVDMFTHFKLKLRLGTFLQTWFWIAQSP